MIWKHNNLSILFITDGFFPTLNNGDVNKLVDNYMDLKFSLYRIDFQERDYWFLFTLVFYKHATFPTPGRNRFYIHLNIC